MDATDLCYTSAVDLAGLIREKKVSPVEVMEALLARIEAVNPKINAYCTLIPEQAMEGARKAEAAVMRGEKIGPLHGVPVSIKDLIFTKGVRTTGGSMIYANFVPEADAIVVQRLKGAGAIVVGKTNTPEFGWKGVTDNPLFGITRNPWDLSKTPGGSSGGAGAAVAAGLGPLAIGSDGGGSIRIPASFSGIFGHKPSFGRVPQYPGFSGWETLGHTGPMTRTVRDAALLMDIIAGPDDRDRNSLPSGNLSYLSAVAHNRGGIKGLKVAWSQNLGYAAVDPAVREITFRAAQVFAELGCELEPADPAIENPEHCFRVIASSDTAANLTDKLDEWGDKMDRLLPRFVQMGQSFSGIEVQKANHQRQALWNCIQPFFEKYDLLLTPTLAVPPFEVESMGPRFIDGVKVSPTGWINFTFPFNLTWQPAATVPAGWTKDGLPVGLQIVGRRHDDVTVLRAAEAYEEANPWAQRRPAIA